MLCSSVQELQSFASDVSADSSCVLLHGDLGAGKTSFVQGYLSALGIDAKHVTSPTYTYVNHYVSPLTQERVLHVDMYRMKSYEQAVKLGIFSLIDEHDRVLIEWPQWEDEYADTSWLLIRIEKINETERLVERTCYGLSD